MLGFCGPLDLEKPAKVCWFLSKVQTTISPNMNY
jgi:hypothetical protein